MIIDIPATEIGALHDLGPLCVNVMKETMFEGKEVLDRMLRDADEANRTPEEIEEDEKRKREEESAKAKKEVDELKNIMDELKEQVDEKTEESNDEMGNITNQTDLNEEENENIAEVQKDVIEDENNNTTVDNRNEEAKESGKEILSFDHIYNKPPTASISTQTDTAEESKSSEPNDTTLSNQPR